MKTLGIIFWLLVVVCSGTFLIWAIVPTPRQRSSRDYYVFEPDEPILGSTHPPPDTRTELIRALRNRNIKHNTPRLAQRAMSESPGVQDVEVLVRKSLEILRRDYEQNCG